MIYILFLQLIFFLNFSKLNLGIFQAWDHGDPSSNPPTPADATSSDAVLFLQLCRTIILNVIVRQLIKNTQFRTHHCTQKNASFSTGIGRKVSYAARDDNRFNLV